MEFKQCNFSKFICKLCYYMQVNTNKIYPDPISLTTWMCLMASFQSGIFALLLEPNLNAWKLTSPLSIFVCLYSVNHSLNLNYSFFIIWNSFNFKKIYTYTLLKLGHSFSSWCVRSNMVHFKERATFLCYVPTSLHTHHYSSWMPFPAWGLVPWKVGYNCLCTLAFSSWIEFSLRTVMSRMLNTYEIQSMIVCIFVFLVILIFFFLQLDRRSGRGDRIIYCVVG